MVLFKRCGTKTPTHTHTHTQILRTRLDWVGQNPRRIVSSTEGYVFVPTDPFRGAEKELRRKLKKHALTISSKTSKQDQRSSLDDENLFIFFSEIYSHEK